MKNLTKKCKRYEVIKYIKNFYSIFKNLLSCIVMFLHQLGTEHEIFSGERITLSIENAIQKRENILTRITTKKKTIYQMRNQDVRYYQAHLSI